MHRHPDNTALLFGPYRTAGLQIGDRPLCLLRDCRVTITSWTAAPIPWPRCRAEGTHGGGSGLLLYEELARAVRQESAAAIMHYWGVTAGVVWRWRKTLGVDWAATEASRLLIHAAAMAGGEAFLSSWPCSARPRTRRLLGRRARAGQPCGPSGFVGDTAMHMTTDWATDQLHALGWSTVTIRILDRNHGWLWDMEARPFDHRIWARAEHAVDAPAPRVWDKTLCLARDCQVVVTIDHGWPSFSRSLGFQMRSAILR